MCSEMAVGRLDGATISALSFAVWMLPVVITLGRLSAQPYYSSGLLSRGLNHPGSDDPIHSDCHDHHYHNDNHDNYDYYGGASYCKASFLPSILFFHRPL